MIKVLKQSNSIPFIAFVVALLLHGLIWYAPLSFQVHNEPQALPKEIEVERWTERKDLQIVDSSRLEDNDEHLKDKQARFGGEFKNRVEEEMRSPLMNRFQEGRLGPVTPDPLEGERLTLRQLLPSSPDRLPFDIREGDQTLLNTDPVLYASFTNRVKNEIYDPWVRHLNMSMQKLEVLGKKLTSDVYITEMSITMDREGSVLSIQTLRSSGILEFDDAPKKAFWEIGTFRNPPVQMFSKDELVHLKYEFHFELKSSSFAIVPWVI